MVGTHDNTIMIIVAAHQLLLFVSLKASFASSPGLPGGSQFIIVLVFAVITTVAGVVSRRRDNEKSNETQSE